MKNIYQEKLLEQYYDMLENEIPVNYTPWVRDLLKGQGIEMPIVEKNSSIGNESFTVCSLKPVTIKTTCNIK